MKAASNKRIARSRSSSWTTPVPENDAEIADSCAARDSRVRVVRREKNGGVSRAYNSGYAVARGDYFTRLSQDDMFREDAIEIMLRCLQAAPPNVGLVYCDMQKVDENGRWLSRWNQADDPYGRPRRETRVVARQAPVSHAGSWPMRDVAAERL